MERLRSLNSKLQVTGKCLTLNTFVLNAKELFISTWITERRSSDYKRTFPTSCACAIQQEVYVDVTVTSEWDGTSSR